MPTSNVICLIRDKVELIKDTEEPVKKIPDIETNNISGPSFNNSDGENSIAESESGSVENNEFEGSSVTDNEEHGVLDPHCVAENPTKISFHDITSAAFMIKSGIEYTPCTVSISILCN